MKAQTEHSLNMNAKTVEKRRKWIRLKKKNFSVKTMAKAERRKRQHRRRRDIGRKRKSRGWESIKVDVGKALAELKEEL